MSQAGLTQQQQKVLVFVREYSRRHGFPPSLREIGQGIDVVNVNAVRGHVSALERKGYIARTPEKARSLRVLEGPSRLSRLKRRLHQALGTNEGVLHQVVYGLAWATWRRRPHFVGQRRGWLAEALQGELIERGWQGLDIRIEPSRATAG